MSDKIVLWRAMYDPAGHDLLADAGANVVVVDSADTQALAAELGDAKALWVRTPERVTEDILDAAPDLVVVSTSGFGTDNIAIDAATARGILVVNHLGFGRTPVAEHTIALMLAAAKQLVWSDRAYRDGSAWSERSGLQVTELAGKTVGIVGLGYIGAELARKLALGFDCRVLAYDPYVDPRLAFAARVEQVADLHTMLGRCDFLCVAAELTDETRKMIDATALAALPQGAIVVNAARGDIVDLDALDAALESGHLRAAGLDVVFPEPLPDGHPLLANPRVTFSPHTAGVTTEAASALTRSAAEQILTALEGRAPRYPVNPATWDGPLSRRP